MNQDETPILDAELRAGLAAGMKAPDAGVLSLKTFRVVRAAAGE